MKPIPILVSNEDVLVVDKPSGLSIHNNEDPENLMGILLKQEGLNTLYPVHRLDRETSGVQIFAVNKQSAQDLSAEFQSDRVGKHYLGLVKGQLKTKEGTWNLRLTDKAEGRKVPQGITKNRVHCATQFKVIQESKYLSLCEFRLLTGRQHQIRKHTAIAKHPLIGDPRYGIKAINSKISKLYGEDRMFLHCTEIEILGTKYKSNNVPKFEIFFKEK